MNTSARISYVIVAASLVLISCLQLGTLLVTVLFGYFALQQLSLGGRRWVGATLYLIAVGAVGCGFFLFSRQAYVSLPKIADSAIPAVVKFAEDQGLELPFTDYASLKAATLKKAQERPANVGHYLRRAGFQLGLLAIGLVVALSMFMSVRWGSEADTQEPRDSLYVTVVRELGARFDTFFASFRLMMGAQIVISAINTVLTAAFLVACGLPYAMVLIVLTFLFGLVPIIGNICSNTLIVAVGFTLSPKTALLALVFLILVHKLEYFLNSRIIGARIKNPMWLTLIALVLGEKLMGIPGLILAPVVLHYIRVETSKAKAAEAAA